MKELEVTWGHVVSVWWAFQWRCIVFGLVGAGIVGFIWGMFGAALGASVAGINASAQVLGLLFGIAVSLWAIKVALTKQYQEFRIVLTTKGRCTCEGKCQTP